MGATNKIQIMLIEELVDNVLAKGERDAAVILSPTAHLLFRISPEQIAQESGVGYVRWPHDSSNLLHILKIRRETAMTAEDLVVNNGGNGQTVETIGESLPGAD